MLNLFSCVVAFSTLILIFAGGLVTSTGSGLSVPDWPSTYGQFMFAFPLSKMVGGILYEHGHRLIASTVGMLIIGLATALWWSEPRAWVRRLGFLALAAVITQGVLGGLTVLFLLPDPISISHAALAQIVFCLTISIAVVTSRGWLAEYRDAGRVTPDDRTLQWVAALTTATIYAQIIVGATMRHTGAGLAIPDFPLAFGRLIPPRWDAGIAIHFAHRVGAAAVTVLALATSLHVMVHHRNRRELMGPAVLLLVALGTQIVLGAYVIWTARQFVVNSAHVANGALVLASSLVLTLRAHRPRFADLRQTESNASASPAPAGAHA